MSTKPEAEIKQTSCGSYVFLRADAYVYGGANSDGEPCLHLGPVAVYLNDEAGLAMIERAIRQARGAMEKASAKPALPHPGHPCACANPLCTGGICEDEIAAHKMNEVVR